MIFTAIIAFKNTTFAVNTIHTNRFIIYPFKLITCGNTTATTDAISIMNANLANQTRILNIIIA